MRSILLSLVLVALAAPAFASDGVLEINQTCAVETGCFPGDAAGFPVTIDGTPGRSYRLTSDLIVPDQGTDGIVISTSSISIDLNGFEIVRSGCQGATENCTPTSGSGVGIRRSSLSNRGISVRNGSIIGMRTSGVTLGDQAHITNLRVRWNRFDGIVVNGFGATISGNTVSENGGDGIDAGDKAIVSGNTAHENGEDGISAGFASTVSGNTASENGNAGIVANAGSTVSYNTVFNNGNVGIAGAGAVTIVGNSSLSNGTSLDTEDDYGIVCSLGCNIRGNSVQFNVGDGIHTAAASTVADNSAYDNGGDGIFAGNGSIVSGNAAMENAGDGIHVEGSSMVRGNTVHQNAEYGLNLDASSRSGYTENVVSGNTLGTVNPGREFGENLCEGNTTCP